MAKREYSWKTTADRNGWHRCNPVTGAVEQTYNLPADDGIRLNLALYGFKQALSDGAATDAGTTAAARDRAMAARNTAIQSGTWAFRDGHGGGGLPDADVYLALVALGDLARRADDAGELPEIFPSVPTMMQYAAFRDTPDRRAKFKAAPAASRTALRAIPPIRYWLENNTDDAAAGDALADLLQS